MSRLEDSEQTIEELEQLVEIYKDIEDETDDFLETQDASMKRTTLKSVIKDRETHETKTDE